MAAAITQATQAEVTLEPGSRSEFSVWAGDAKVAEKSRTGFPTEAEVIDAVTRALAKPGQSH